MASLRMNRKKEKALGNLDKKKARYVISEK
jgi:hypothetical protein